MDCQLSSIIKFVTLILFSARVSTAFRTFSSVSFWPRAFQVPMSRISISRIKSWFTTHSMSSHHTNFPPTPWYFPHRFPSPRTLFAAHHSRFLLLQRNFWHGTSQQHWLTRMCLQARPIPSQLSFQSYHFLSIRLSVQNFERENLQQALHAN